MNRLRRRYKDIEEMQEEDYDMPAEVEEFVQEQPVENEGENPLTLLDEIEANPTPKGVLPLNIGGRTVDLFQLENYVKAISPRSLKTILRYHNARTISEMKGYSKFENLKRKKR